MVLHLNLPSNGYDVTIEKGCINKVSEIFNLNRKVLIVTDSGVPSEYAKHVASQCLSPYILTIPQGERNKNFDNFCNALDVMVKNNFTRTDCVVAVGGGVVGDLAGFVSACFMRGVDFYNIPTTVLACIDSSVGGKTAVDFDGYKNIVGAFHQPKGVIIDIDLLKTLPKRQVSNGLVEGIKMALTSSKELFELFESQDVTQNLERIITEAVKIKIDVVEKDEKESGLRRVLNFGHTLGHGIETASNMKLYHGECVALGMLCMCQGEVKKRLIKVLEKLGVPLKFDGDIRQVIDACKRDKKCDGDTINLVKVLSVGEFKVEKVSFDEFVEIISKGNEWRK